MDFYNTTHETTNLPSYRSQAQKQDVVIAGYFKQAGRLTPGEVEMIANMDGHVWPLWSIRRSINTLSDERKGNLLIKTKMKLEGAFGRDEHIWQLREEG